MKGPARRWASADIDIWTMFRLICTQPRCCDLQPAGCRRIIFWPHFLALGFHSSSYAKERNIFSCVRPRQTASNASQRSEYYYCCFFCPISIIFLIRWCFERNAKLLSLRGSLRRPCGGPHVAFGSYLRWRMRSLSKMCITGHWRQT